ncbi:hypothetical protein ACA910_020428 [Epithemia clementina (nom. ined.)]
MPRFALLEEDEDGLRSDDEAKSESLDESFEFKDGMAQSRYFLDENSSDDESNNSPLTKWKNEPPIGQSTQQALLSARINTEITPMKTLIKYAIQDASGLRNNDVDNSIVGLQDAVDALSLIVSHVNIGSESKIPTPEPVELPATYLQLGEAERRIRQEMEFEKRRYDRQHEETRRDIRALLEEEYKKAELNAENQRREEEAAHAKREAEMRRLQHLEEQRIEKEQQQEAAEEEAREKERTKRLQKEQEAENAKRREQAARDYLTRADKLVAQLKQLQESVEPFEKSQALGRRRLEMKKVVNGKVNTLSEDVEKIRSVAAEVSAAIAKAKDEDRQIQELVNAGNTEYTPEMAKGKRYFVDLLCSKVIVRVQAEGFNGQRGDGFPLAHMLAIVAVEHKDIVPVLAAHVYTVCPTAIPRLPKVGKDATEDDVMESLGMLKGKDGQFETFERFLARTEGFVSMISNIVSSQPDDHTLFGGHPGAIKWLTRFLSELPDPPTSPLPLITAPVLDAFLTGAGHMLANTYPDDFRKCLETIENDCVPRLDDGPVGMPSVTRLKKTLNGGFDSFKSTLPSRALGELYHGSSITGTRKPLSSAPAAANNYNNNNQSQQNNPFGGGGGGGGSQTSASPFGVAPSNKPPNPFGGGGQTSIANPFGDKAPDEEQSSTGQSSPFVPSASPFGGTSNVSSQQSGPETSDAMLSDVSNDMNETSAPQQSFGMSMSGFGNMGVPSSGGFGVTSTTASKSPFGAPAATPGSLFGAPAPSSVFGASTTQSQTPFGANAPASFGSPAAQNSPFGSSASTPVTSNTTPFGASAPAPFGAANPPALATPFGSPAPFGGGALGSSPFGGGSMNPSPFTSTAAPSMSTFGGNNSTPFGSAPSSFGGAGGAAPISSNFGTFGSQAPSPFGGGGSAFGTSSTPNTAFGTPAQSGTPFGTPYQQSTPFSTPFGSTPQPTTPFGGGGGTAYGAGSSFGAPVADNRQPCKFFARGQCRYGNSCKFSHEGGLASGAFSDPFGGGPRR